MAKVAYDNDNNYFVMIASPQNFPKVIDFPKMPP